VQASHQVKFSAATLFGRISNSPNNKLSMKIKMKTPISYYGGKQKLCTTILSLIPEHTLYCEPFVGGGAIFFGKDPSRVEVLNDTNKELINFYRVVQNRYVDLESMIRCTLHSRRLHEDATTIYSNPHLFDEIKRAWAVWVLSSQSFSSLLDGSWGYDKSENTTTQKIINNRDRFSEQLAIRLQNVQIECADATYIIKSRDTKDSFFYCDPPYPNSNCGHYDGYSIEDFTVLLKQLQAIKGKFLLSSYPIATLGEFIKKNGWYCRTVEQRVSVNKGYGKKKVEMMTANFEI
jgi:DNA adenine methylase